MKFTENVFTLLSANKKFPYYQAERRIDIFINLFLEEILNNRLHKKSIKFILPELALKKVKNNQSAKLDYLCIDKQEELIYFVELKTDKQSFSKKQLSCYLEYTSWGRCIDELQIISKNPRGEYKQKFSRLIKHLSENELLDTFTRNWKIKIVFLTPGNKRLSNAIQTSKVSESVHVINLEDLTDFESKVYPEEWKHFYSNIILPLLQEQE
jgi:hypothetical protein